MCRAGLSFQMRAFRWVLKFEAQPSVTLDEARGIGACDCCDSGWEGAF